MTVRRICSVSLVAVILAGVAAWVGPAWAQTPGAEKPRTGESAEELVQSALKLIDSGDYEQAGTLIQRAKQLSPNLPKLSLAEGLFYMNVGMAMIKQSRVQAGYKGKAGYIAEATGRLQEYNNTAEGKNDYRGFAALGSIYKDSRTFRSAVPPLEQAKKLAPVEENGKFVRAEITLDLASSYLGLLRKKEALETAKDAESMAPSDPKIQLGLARVAANTEDFAVAESAAKKAIDLCKAKIQGQPFDKDAHATLQGCYEVIGYVKNTALGTAPDDGAILYALACATRDSAEVNRRVGLLSARDLVQQAIEKEPKKYEWQVFAAQIDADLGAYPEAAKRLNEILKESPDNKEAAKLLETLPSQTGAERSK